MQTMNRKSCISQSYKVIICSRDSYKLIQYNFRRLSSIPALQWLHHRRLYFIVKSWPVTSKLFLIQRTGNKHVWRRKSLAARNNVTYLICDWFYTYYINIIIIVNNLLKLFATSTIAICISWVFIIYKIFLKKISHRNKSLFNGSY